MRIPPNVKKIVVILIIVGTIGYLFLPFSYGVPTVHAQALPDIGTLGIGIALCQFSGTLEGLLDGVLRFIGSIIPDLGDILGGFFGGTVPVGVKSDDPASTKEAKDCLSAQVKRAFIRSAVNDVLNWVRGEGAPRYIEDFPGVLIDAADRAGAVIVSDVTNANICRPFRASLEILVQRAAFPRDLFDRRIGCTLSQAIDRQLEVVQRFQDDFRDGGWPMWIRTHQTKNTLLGAYLIANNERIRILGEETEGAKLQTNVSQGFKDTTVCTEAIFTYSNIFAVDQSPLLRESVPDLVVGSDEWNEFIAEKGASGAVCVTTKTILPASTAADQVTDALSSQRDNLVASEEWHGIVQEIMTALISDILKNGFPVSI